MVQVEPGSAAHYLVAASGALPAIAAMLYFDWLDRKRPEPWRLRYAVTVVGMLSVRDIVRCWTQVGATSSMSPP